MLTRVNTPNIPQVCGIPITINKNIGWELEYISCPGCNGVFGVDSSYLDQVSELVYCPMCQKAVIIIDEADCEAIVVLEK